MKYKKSLGAIIFDYSNIFFLALLSFCFLYPVYYTALLSFSSAEALIHNKVSFLPVDFTLASYEYLLLNNNILRYYFNTVIYAGLGTVIMLFFTSMLAYPLTFSNFSGRKFITIILTITMFFSGGLIPYYLLVTRMGFTDTIWVMVIPGAISAFNVIVFRTFFKQIPASLGESALIDGAGYFKILFTIIIPLSTPLIATFSLFSIVGYWNDYLTSVMFLRNERKYPIQMLLRSMLILFDYKDSETIQVMSLKILDIKMVRSAAVVVTIVPIMIVYPFLQKYFTKGIMVGAIKE